MGGQRQATCPTAPAGAKVPQANPVRYHESGGEVHFHDDMVGLKCVIPSSIFFTEWAKWRKDMMSGDLHLGGHDDGGGHARVSFLPYTDDGGQLQVATTVEHAPLGDTISDLDKLANYS